MNISEKRANRAILALAFLSLLLPPSVKAEIKKFAFSGVISSVDNRGFQLDASIAAGTPFQGYYVFDTTAVDSSADPTVGMYQFTGSTFGVVVKVGNYVFRTNPQHVNFLMSVVNRTTDGYLLRSYNNVCSRPVSVDHISWQLDDQTGTVLSNDLLPTTPPTLSQWQSLFGLNITGTCSSFFIRGHINAIAETSPGLPNPPAASTAQAVEVKWQSQLGYYYQVQRTIYPTTSSQRAQWTNVGEPVLGDGTELSRFFPGAPTSYVAYRVVLAASHN